MTARRNDNDGGKLAGPGDVANASKPIRSRPIPRRIRRSCDPQGGTPFPLEPEFKLHPISLAERTDNRCPTDAAIYAAARGAGGTTITIPASAKTNAADNRQ